MLACGSSLGYGLSDTYRMVWQHGETLLEGHELGFCTGFRLIPSLGALVCEFDFDINLELISRLRFAFALFECKLAYGLFANIIILAVATGVLESLFLPLFLSTEAAAY